MGTIRQWLAGIGFEQYVEAFEREQIDADSAPYLTDANLKDLGLPMGPRARFLAAVQTLAPLPRSSVSSPEGTSGNPVAQSPPAVEAERRQLTVLFCDMVGFTALSEKLDPEVLRDLIGAYRGACGGAITRYGGHVAQHLGDGVMAYFGWPLAHEDDAERALHAALEIVQAVKHVEISEALKVRIGIATGTVVVGQSGEEGADAKLAVGETPNVAARLQGVAGTDEIVISPATRRLLGSAFELTDLGEQALKGIAEPVRVWRVEAASRLPTRFEQAHGVEGLTPLVGREEELALLLRRWAHVKEGEGQLVLIEGEPGIGKSRLTQAFREHLASEPHTVLRYQCSPFHQNSALYPSIEQLEYAAGFARKDSVEQKLDKLEAILAETPAEVAQTAPLFAALLSLPLDRYPALQLSPQKQKEKTLEALVGQIESLAQRKPVLMIYEDVHWIDATSQEALDLLVPRLQLLPVMLLVTHRPEYRALWQGKGQAQVSTLGLTRMTRRQASELVARMTGQRGLPEEVLTQILVKTDGVPLFVEELTKTVLESGLLQETGDRFELKGVLPPLAIPSTLRDSLIARLDRLAPVKEIAQIGACIGREFSYSLLERVAAVKGEPLVQGLQQLVDSGLIFCKGALPEALYTFKHALVQDAAYDSMLKATRQQLHAQIAQVLEQEFADIVTSGPELLAHHFTQAGLNGRAVPYWVQAGERASSRVALAEAVNHLTTALSVNSRLPASTERDRWELEIRVSLGMAYQASLGWAAVQTVQTLEPAREIAIRLGEDEKLAPILYYLWTHHAMRCEYPAALKILDQLDGLARSRRDATLSLVARYVESDTRAWMGDFKSSAQACKQVLNAYDPEKHGHFVLTGNMDAKCDVLVWAGYCLWALGYPDQARRAAEDGIDLARRLGRAFNLCWSLCGSSAYTLLQLGETRLALQWVAEARAVALEHGMVFVIDVVVRSSHGYALIEQGNHEEGNAQLTRSNAGWRNEGGLHLVPYTNMMRARALTDLGRFDEARSLLQEAVELTNLTGHRAFEAEVHRVLGELNQQQPTSDVQVAEASFRKALEVARIQDAKGLELRAAMNLARLWQSRGKRKPAYDLLSPIYNWFTEGFDTRDLVDARKLLHELS